MQRGRTWGWLALLIPVMAVLIGATVPGGHTVLDDRSAGACPPGQAVVQIYGDGGFLPPTCQTFTAGAAPLCPIGQVMVGVDAGQPVCAFVASVLGFNQCPAGQYQIGLDGGAIVCASLATPLCPAGQVAIGLDAGAVVCVPDNGSYGITCPAGQFIQQSTNGTDGGNCGSPAALSGWNLVDCDLTAQSNQTLASDNTYTVCNHAISVVNSQMSSPSMNITNGTGLLIKPADAGTFYFGSGAGAADFINAPLIALKLSDWIPNYTSDTPVEVAAYVTTANQTAQFSGWVVGIDDYYGPSARDCSWYFPNDVVVATPFDQPNLWFNGLRKQDPSGSSANGFASTNSHKITLPHGVQGADVAFWDGNWNAGWPPWGFIAGTRPSYASDFDSVTFGCPANPDGIERMVVACQQWTSTTLITCTVQHISVWYKVR